MNRILRAYRTAWRRHPAATLAALLAAVLLSIAGVVIDALQAPVWTPLSAVVLVAAVLLLRYAPDGDS